MRRFPAPKSEWFLDHFSGRKGGEKGTFRALFPEFGRILRKFMDLGARTPRITVSGVRTPESPFFPRSGGNRGKGGLSPVSGGFDPETRHFSLLRPKSGRNSLLFVDSEGVERSFRRGPNRSAAWQLGLQICPNRHTFRRDVEVSRHDCDVVMTENVDATLFFCRHGKKKCHATFIFLDIEKRKCRTHILFLSSRK